MNRYPAFTLAELLIALAILGVIATFTIPKILSGQQEARKKAVFKETFGMLSAINYQGWLTKELNDCTFRTYFFARINAVKFCSPGSATGGGCWTQPYFGFQPTQSGFILPNGATVAGFEQATNPCPVSADGPIIDWNGAEGPNQEGVDQMEFTLNYSNATVTNFGVSTRPGGSNPYGALSKQLYNEIYQ